MTDKPRIVLGVAGGIAAYKACEVLRGFTETGHDVTVVPTAAALRFVGAPTFEALSGKPVAADVWSDVPAVPHVRIGQTADLVVVAPATADLLAKAAHGLADDLLTNTLLTARCPIVFAPAMHTEMWEHPATVANVATLRERGHVVVDPADGRLTGADTGKGRLPDPAEIVATARGVLTYGGAADLGGGHVVVSAGGTREFLDPVRFLGNRSSGLQGFAVARAAAARGARVTLVAANVSLAPPAGVDVVDVVTTAELRDAVLSAVVDADVLVMAAAVADFRPAAPGEHKIKKAADGSAPALALEQNPDILAEIAASGPDERPPVVVGFAAETGDDTSTALEHAAAKARRKGCDLLVANNVAAGAVFGAGDNHVTFLDAGGAVLGEAEGSKDEVAHAICGQIASRLADA